MKRMKLFAVLPALALLGSTNVFAANQYGIEYTGGEALGEDNLTVDADLVSSLTPLIELDGTTVTAYGTWQDGYRKRTGGVCQETKYFTVSPGHDVTTTNGVKISNSKYTFDLTITGVALDGVEDGALVAIAPYSDKGYISVGGYVYSDAVCETVVDNVIRLNTAQDNGKAFVETNIKLYKNGSSAVYKVNNLYFGLTEIDAAQSYKVLNTDNLLEQSTMVAESASALQSPDTTLRNMFVADGNYIYSQYDGGERIELNDDASIYIPLTDNTQESGLNIVFGFANAAASGIEYFAKQLNVMYVSDDNGVISGITSEKVIAGESPSGSVSTPNEGYELAYWTADKDVTLADGATIRAGELMTMEQIETVVVTEDLVFTAHHVAKTEPAPFTPNTGMSTGETNAVAVITSVFGVALGALVIGLLLPRLKRQKIDFKK